MKNTDLDKVLRSTPVPEPPDEFWEELPAEVTRLARARLNEAEIKPAASRRESFWTARPWTRPALALGLTVLCVLGAFWLGYWRGRDSGAGAEQIARMQKYLQEVTTLFPNRVRAIEFDRDGVQLLLAQEANVPNSPAVYVKICGPEGCRQFITFSGQQIKVDGEVCDVLVNHQGSVLVVGSKTAWAPGDKTFDGPYQIEARLL